MLSRLDNHFRVQETALKLRAARQELIAANIANADTPNYKARDVDFTSAFNNALAGGNTQPALATTDARHLQTSISVDIFPASAVLYRTPSQPSIDGNTVNVDEEMVAFTDNALRYQAAITFMQKRIEGLSSAIKSN